MPGVSRKTTCASGSVRMPRMRLRVVCGLGVTMATLAPTSAFSSVDLPTLLNALVGAKVAIVTPKPQTTRNRILGIRTLPEAQVVFLDTPGIHEARSLLNRRMVATARKALAEAAVVLFLVDAAAGVAAGDRALAATLAPLP